VSDAAVTIAINLAYILERGAEGSHILFRLDDIRRALAARSKGDLDTAAHEEAERLVRSVASLPSLELQRDLIEGLDDERRDLLIRRYFEFIDEYVASHGHALH
jgi:hypothetical protein